MMTSMESMDLISSVLDGELSFWSRNGPKNDNETSLDTLQMLDILASTGRSAVATDGLAGCQDNDPLPDWMSEKVHIPNLLDALEDGNIDELQVDALSSPEDLLNSMIVDSGALTSPLSLAEYPNDEPFFALSPASSLGSDGTAANHSTASSSPSSPFALEIIQDDLYSTRETDFEEDDSLEFLLNSSGDVTDFELHSPLPVNLPLSSQEDLELLQQKISTVIVQHDKDIVRPASKTGKVRIKLKTKDRRERKKGQNKEAATRYRNKKKIEVQSLSSEMDGLEGNNEKLRGKVESLEQEIKYLKNLMLEIYKVKGQIKIMKSP